MTALRRAVALLCMFGAAIASFGAAGQPAPGKHVVGFINSGPPAVNAKNVAAFRAGMAELGYVEGRNLEIVFRWAEQRTDLLPTLASELVGYGARVLIVEHGHTRSLDEAPTAAFEIDEFLAPLLDVIPAQIFADALARKLGVGPGFRYIGKVVTQL